MLTETFIASIGVQSNAHRTDAGKDATIIVFEHQPVVQTKCSCKKSVTSPHCLATSASHIIAAQQDKAVVHVYTREKSSQEAIVPFPEKITCITLACADTVLVLGTTEGKIFLWETASGRQVHASQAHLQAVNALAVDTASNHLVSVSSDASAQVWSLSNLLAFDTDIDARGSILSFDAHRATIRDVALGHSSSCQNFAATIAEDKMCLLWNYHDGTVLATYLLSYAPAVVAIDAADRAVYVGYQDGSLQQLDLFSAASKSSKSSSGGTSDTIQPADKGRMTIPDNTHGSLLSMAISFDSTLVLTGHESGSILVWDVATGHASTLALHPPIPGPVTNLLLEPVFKDSTQPFIITSVVKPKFGASADDSDTMPFGHTVHMQFTAAPKTAPSAFHQALTSPCVPQSMLDSGLDELARWKQQPSTNGHHETTKSADDYMALDDPEKDAKTTLAAENAELKQQLASLRRVQMATFDRMEKLSAEREVLLQRENDRMLKSQPQDDG